MTARMHLGAQDDPTVAAEVDRLLGGRTRDIRLSRETSQLFNARIWPQTAKIVRAWMVWVAVLDVLTLGLYLVLLPKALAVAMLWPGAIIPPVSFLVVAAWKRPLSQWLQGAALLAGMFLILLSIALVGVVAGAEFYERHLNIMLFVAITAIIIFSVPLVWTVSIAVMAMGLYLAFQLANPSLQISSAIAGTLFFASGIYATVAARRTMTLLAKKTFLLELRDHRRVAALADANEKLILLARTDPLTGLANRRWMTETLDRFWGSGADSGGVAAILMCDIDDFKMLNDRLGHAQGDRCLIKVAEIIRDNVRRDGDHAARYGGEEFLVFLPDVSEDEAVVVAERVRRKVEEAGLSNPASRVSRHVTVSIGVAVQRPGDEKVGAEVLQRKADEALYMAKQSGRNRVVLHGVAPTGRKFGG